MMNELEKNIAALFEVKSEDLKTISSHFHPVSLGKGECFFRENGYANHMAFVKSGLLREWVDLPDKEITKWIATPGYFITDLNSFLFDKPAASTLQALTDCELYLISKDDYRNMGKSIPTWNTVEKLFMAKCFSTMGDRILSFISMTAEERYAQLWNANKELFNQVPLQYLASMLGMTPETFSRLRKKIASIS
ncbi:MAG: Crp/Fnr family transcriptional regulator [Fluviicola sp.]|jgi:CRP-like cAMP-binding protein|uniref:Crp/Fnr family transcriptional regulator n=1 Tax=Fluviicola sp. TaxID=1917219 RepID=UPI002632AB5A|nr:Crp/Fnr family transcriptional regulator [Fluviicola sp.]MDF3025728.1 Crp/Fnr family transcriptional regulator [Fluviicola sp.]